MMLESSKKLTVRASATTTTRKIARLRASLKKRGGPDRSGGYPYFHHSTQNNSTRGTWYGYKCYSTDDRLFAHELIIEILAHAQKGILRI
jgi:hypothetical protein